MTKFSKVRYLVIGALLSLAVGAPVASAVANRPAKRAVPVVATVTDGTVIVVTQDEGEIEIFSDAAPAKPVAHRAAHRAPRRVCGPLRGIETGGKVRDCSSL